MLRKLGVLSFSEPYWVHNIESLPSLGMDHDMIGRVSEVGDDRKSLPKSFEDGISVMTVPMYLC